MLPPVEIDAFAVLLVGGLDRLREQLAEGAEVRGHDREHAGERSEPDDVDPDQRPDQRVDAADGVEAAADRKAEQTSSA